MRAVGSSLPRIDALEKVTGSPVYAGDLELPDQAWLHVVFAGIPHAEFGRWMQVRHAPCQVLSPS